MRTITNTAVHPPEPTTRRRFVRDGLLYLLFGGAAAAIWSNKDSLPKREPYSFRAIKLGNQTYIEDKIFDETRVFELVTRKAASEVYNSYDALVGSVNSQHKYSNGERSEVVELAVQLNLPRPDLHQMEPNEARNFEYKPVTRGNTTVLPNRDYLIPREIKELGTLEGKVRVTKLEDVRVALINQGLSRGNVGDTN